MDREPDQIEQVAEGLWRVPLRSLTLPPATRTNTFVWESPAGWVVVDPGSSRRGELARLESFLHDRLGPDDLTAYVVTHHHPDHWGGLATVLARRKAPVVARDPSQYGRLAADFKPPAWLAQQLGEAALIETPGHASDHLVVRTGGGDVLAGDLVAGIGTVVINPPDGDMAAYRASLRHLLEVGVARIFPAHGPTIEDGSSKLHEYLAHRELREQQVLAALEARQPATPTSLVPVIYPALSLVLRPIAARSVLAHLLQLEAAGRVVRAGRKWRLG